MLSFIANLIVNVLWESSPFVIIAKTTQCMEINRSLLLFLFFVWKFAFLILVDLPSILDY